MIQAVFQETFPCDRVFWKKFLIFLTKRVFDVETGVACGRRKLLFVIELMNRLSGEPAFELALDIHRHQSGYKTSHPSLPESQKI